MENALGLGIAEMQESSLDTAPAEIERLIEERTAAREAKDFALSDEIRDQLDGLGIEIMDGAEGTTWRKKG